MTNYEIE